MRRKIATGKYCGTCPCIDETNNECHLYEKKLNYQKTKEGSYVFIRTIQCIVDKPQIVQTIIR